MRLNEFSSPLNKYLVTVKVYGTSVKTLIHAESQSHARLMLGKMFGKDNVQSVNSISTNESQNTISLNLQETVSSDDLVKLWQIVSQNIFQAVEKERREAEEAQRLEASKPKKSRTVRSPSRSVSSVKAVPPKTVRPKAVNTQAVNPQSVKTQAVKSQVTKPQVAMPKAVNPQVAMPQVTVPQIATQNKTPQSFPKRMQPQIAQKAKPQIQQTKLQAKTNFFQ